MDTNRYNSRFLFNKTTILSLLLLILITQCIFARGRMKPIPVKPKSGFSAVLVGGPTVIFEIGGLRLMTDPTLDEAGTQFKIPGNNVVRKLAGPAVREIGRIDIVLLSHDQHPDNLDNGGRKFLPKAGKVITTKSAAARLSHNAVGLDPWENLAFKSREGHQVKITALPARHGPSGIEKIAGSVIGFMIEVSGAENFQIYISGDTEYFSGIDEIGKKFDPAYAFVFAGAAQPTGPINVTMNSNDLIELARVFPHSILIPVHTEGWSHYTQHGADYLKAFQILGISGRIRILQPGSAADLQSKI